MRFEIRYQQKQSTKNMQKATWNNKMGHRERKAKAFIITADGAIYEFSGLAIPNVCHSQAVKYEKNGKWSNTTFQVTMHDSAKLVGFVQDWETGRTWPQPSWDEAFLWLKERAPALDQAMFEKFIREKYSGAAAIFDEQKQAEQQFSIPAAPAPTPTQNPA